MSTASPTGDVPADARSDARSSLTLRYRYRFANALSEREQRVADKPKGREQRLPFSHWERLGPAVGCPYHFSFS